MYPGPDGDAWSSIRLENMRDGIEDYEYFTILKKDIKALKRKGGKHSGLIQKAEKLLEIGPEIIADPVTYTRDYKKLLKRREEIGKTIVIIEKILDADDES